MGIDIGAFGLQAGTVGVVTTSNAPLPPEHFAQRAVDRLMYVADNAPPPIRDQAYAYREQMRDIILGAIKAALVSDRAYRPKG
jgi:hypothetical protein